MLEQDHGPPSVLWKVRRQVSRHQNEFGVNYLGLLLELERGMAVWERAVSGIPYDSLQDFKLTSVSFPGVSPETGDHPHDQES